LLIALFDFFNEGCIHCPDKTHKPLYIINVEHFGIGINISQRNTGNAKTNGSAGGKNDKRISYVEKVRIYFRLPK